MFDFSFFIDSYHSLFYNMSCICINQCNNVHNHYYFIIIPEYNINNYISTIVYIYEYYFIINKFYWLNQNLTLVFLFYSYETFIYSMNLWRLYTITIINEIISKNSILSTMVLSYQNAWILLGDNLYIKYNIINKKLPKVSNLFHFINFFVDNNIFPYKNSGEIYFYFKYFHLNFTLNNPKTHFIYEDYFSHNIIKLRDNLNFIHYYQWLMLKKAGIVNYLIVSNNYLLSFLIPDHWYNWGFKKHGYLYYSLPMYWDYDYIQGIFLYLNYFEISKIFKHNIYYWPSQDNINQIINLNSLYWEKQKLDFYVFILEQISIIYSFTFFWLSLFFYFCYMYFYIIFYYFYKVFLYIRHFVNWYINIFIFCLSLKIQDYLFFYFFNPLYLYFGKKLRETINFYENIIHKKNLILLKNKKHCDINLIYHYNLVQQSYRKYLTFLLVSILFRYIYIFIFIIFYNLKYLLIYFLKLNSYILIIFLYLRYIYMILYLKLSYFISIDNIKNFWIRYHYIYLEFFNFYHQNKLIGSNFIFNFINWWSRKEFIFLNYNIILNKLEYTNDFWKFFINFINVINTYYKKVKYMYIFYFFNKSLIIIRKNILIKHKYINIFLLYISINKICNIIKYLLEFIKLEFTKKFNINALYFFLGYNLFFIFDISLYIFIFLYKWIIKLLYKFRIIYIIIFIIFIYSLNINLQIFILPFEHILLYELSWISNIIIWIYDQKSYFFFEWLIAENNYIYHTIKIKLQLLKIKEDIWNDIFVHFNFQKKKWQNVTKEKIWMWINPIYFIIFLFYELKIQWFISALWNYILTSILTYIYLNYIPFLYWYNLNYFFTYILSFIFINMLYILFLLKCYYSYIYIYILPHNLGHIFCKYYYTFFLKFIYIKYFMSIIYIYIFIFIKFIILYNFMLINFIINIIYLNLHIYTLNNLIIILNFFSLLFIELILYNIDIVFDNHIFNAYIHIYIFINIYYKIQSNIDIICSYFRLNRYKIYKWNKFSKKKKNYRYFINNFLIEYFYSPTYEDNLIALTSIVTDSSILRSDILNYWININILIKYWYWTLTNYTELIIYGIGPISFASDEFQSINLYYKYANFPIDIIEAYDMYWWLSYIHFDLFNKWMLMCYYTDILEYLLKSFFNLGKLNLSKFLNYLSIYFFFLFFFFRIWYIYNNHMINEDLNFNTEYLWKNFRLSEKKNNYLNIDNKVNNWLSALKVSDKIKKTKYNNNIIIKTIINYNNNLLLLNYKNFEFIQNKNLINFKNCIYYIKENKLINNIKLKKLWIHYKFKYIFRFDNLFINFLNLKLYQSYNLIYKMNFDILYLLISYLYKKNKYAYYINKQELYKIVIPLNQKYYFFNENNIKLQNNIMLFILNYFNIIDKLWYNNKGPLWLLNKNNSTIFYNYSLNNKKENLDLILMFPYEFYYFFLIIIYIYLYYKIILYGLIWNQKNWIGSSIYEKREWFNFVLNNLLWKFSIIYINKWESIKSSLLNPNTPNGIFGQQIVNIYISTNKYYYLQYLLKYKKNIYLYDNTFYYIIKENIGTNILINYITYKNIFIFINIFLYVIQIGIKRIYKKYISKLFFFKEDFYNIITYRNNIKKIKYIYTHYKFKKMLWNNYLKK